MKIIPKVAYTLLAVILTFGAFSSSYAQEMSMDEYKQRLAAAQKREADAKACQTQVQGEIDAAQKALDETNAAITKAWDDIYAMLGVTKADVDAAFRLAYKEGLKGITVYRYGSKPGQVLSLPSGAEGLTLSHEFAEECRLCSV